jgi:hypothetical protein
VSSSFGLLFQEEVNKCENYQQPQEITKKPQVHKFKFVCLGQSTIEIVVTQKKQNCTGLRRLLWGWGKGKQTSQFASQGKEKQF